MKAAILEDGDLQIRDVPIPEVPRDAALVKLSVAGVCHSDLHLARGDWPEHYLPPGPNGLGHEGIGIVERLGDGAEQFVREGDRVILGLGGTGGGYWCGACEFCLSGRPRLCSHAKPLLGTYAEYVSVWAPALVKLPDEIGNEHVPLACAGLTAYSAVKKLHRSGILPGKPVAIVGAAGGLGHYAVQIANAFGYEVIGVDVGEDRIDFVRSLGAASAYDIGEAVGRIKKEHGGAYGSIVFAGRVDAFALGLKLLRRGGLFVGVGMPALQEGALGIVPIELLSRDTTIMFSAVGTVEDMRELVHLVAAGRIETHVGRTGAMSELNEIFAELEGGAYAGRAIIDRLQD